MGEFAPLSEEAARPFRHTVGGAWSVDETYATAAGTPVYVYRAIDGRDQAVDVSVRARRATDDAATFFRRAIAATYPPALAATLPGVLHETGKAVQPRIERDHRHLTGRLRPLRGFKSLAGARMLCRAHAFLRNLRGGSYDLPWRPGSAGVPVAPPVKRAWDALTTELLTR